MSGVAPDLPIWAQWFAALAVPIAAVVGVGLGAANYLLSMRRRRDDLFDRRFEFYVRLRNYYLLNCDDFYYVHPADRGEIRPGVPLEQFQLSAEARFLFGKDIADFIRDLHWRDSPNYNPPPSLTPGRENDSEVQNRFEDWRNRRLSYPTPAWFDKPFMKYLALGK